MTLALSFRADLFRIASWWTAQEGSLSGVRLVPHPEEGLVIAGCNGLGKKAARIALVDPDGYVDRPCTLLLDPKFLNRVEDQARILQRKLRLFTIGGQIYTDTDEGETDLADSYTLIDAPYPALLAARSKPIARKSWRLPQHFQTKLAQTTYALARAYGMDSEGASNAEADYQHQADGSLRVTFPFFYQLDGDDLAEVVIAGVCTPSEVTNAREFAA